MRISVVAMAQFLPPPSAKGVRDKVQRPALVRPLRQRHWRPGPQRPFPAAAATQLQPYPRQEITEPPIAKPPSLGRQLTQPLPQVCIVRTARLIPRYPSGNSNQMTRPALAQPVAVPGMGDRTTLRAGRHHFSDEISFKTAMSSIASAIVS